MSDDKRVAVLGAGMHPWGKWGRSFVEYGVHAAREALADADLSWPDVQFVSGADTIRNGYPASSPVPPSPRPRLDRAKVASSYAACASGASAIANARAQILAGCATSPSWSGDTTPRASSRRSAASAATTRTGCASTCSARPTPPTSPSTPGGAWTASAPPTRTSPGEGEELPPRRGQPERPLRDVVTAEQCWPRRWWPTRCASSRSAPPPTAGGPRAVLDGVRPPPCRRRACRDHRRGLDGHPALSQPGDRDAELLDGLGRRGHRRHRGLQALDRARRLRGGWHRTR